MKESRSKEVKMTKMVKAKENVLDAEIQITSSDNAQSHQEARTKGLLSEEHGAIVGKMRKKRLKTKLVLMDHGREFDNEVQFRNYCDSNGITHNFFAPRTPQSNEVVERKNHTLQEMSRTDAVVVRDFYKKFYNSLGIVPNRCSSSIGKTWGLLSFSREIGWEGLITV
ncbi:retrovirus-related pol polyprotein from transposon TNT 1-94 [Tanacetum coccineum]